MRSRASSRAPEAAKSASRLKSVSVEATKGRSSSNSRAAADKAPLHERRVPAAGACCCCTHAVVRLGRKLREGVVRAGCPRKGIAPLIAAVATLRPTREHLTPLHAEVFML